MKAPLPLAQLQRLFHDLLRAPEGVQSGLDAMVERGELDRADISFAIVGDDRLDATGRLDIYAGMYFYRLLDVLADEHARTAERIGEVNFHNLVTDYLIAHPPSAPSLREAGAAFPSFLDGHALASSFPALGDVARIERARLEVFDALDEDVLDRDAFLAESAAAPETFKLKIAAATRVFQVDPRAFALWREPAAAPPDLPSTNTPTHAFVYRTGHAVFHRPCIEDEARCLEAIGAEPISLPELAERLLKHDASAEETSERFAELLELWLDNAVLVSPPRPGNA
ncbi:MAG: DNA-binding domain-containing protein [Myxococcota bacterium]|nr:DNA-binding domain-containing protein [Myxococcota bacterium]